MNEKQPDTRSAILSIARDLMRQLGYNAFSYADIARRLNVKNAAIHYHYPAKADLLADVIETYITEYRQLEKQLAASNLDPCQRLQQFIGKYAQLIGQNSICIIGSVASDYNTLPESVKTKVAGLISLVIGMVERTLQEGREEGLFRFNETPGVRALLIMTNLAAGVQLARITGKADFIAIEQAIVDQLIK